MNKAQLRESWSKYCDTDKLIDDAIKLFKQYGYANSEHGICVMLHNFFTQKESLIKIFMNSSNYHGDLRICLKKDFERQLDANAIYDFCNNFPQQIDINQVIQYNDADGKMMMDYLRAGSMFVDVDNIHEMNEQNVNLPKLRLFDYSNGWTHESIKRYRDIKGYIDFFKHERYSTLSTDIQLEGSKSTIKHGTKTSRAFNKVFTHYGVDKLSPEVKIVNGVEKTVYPYDRLFAEYSDLVTERKRKMYFFISLNPLDYLTMSIGVNWNSCHSIDGGGYKGGCLSYMLDSTSMITFVVEELEDKPVHLIPKVYRQMYHYEDGIFLQNRLYPQGNDGATNLYEKFRNFVVEEFTSTMNTGNEWSVELGTKACDTHSESTGVHYNDYLRNSSCSVFYPAANKDDIKKKRIHIGHQGICVRCGQLYSVRDRLNHRWNSECIDALDDIVF